LSVRFPGTRTDVSARLVRASPDADVALIKIDAFQTLITDTLASDDKVDIGEPVVVLGYPGFSVKNKAIFDTIESGEVNHHDEIIP
jgi:S1-C subfamily serine protease